MTYGFWHDFAGPLATVLASVVAVLVTVHLGRSQAQIAREQARIAKLQADLAKTRLNHDLYDRRFILYTATCALLSRVVEKNNVDDMDIVTFIRDTATAVFLLDSDMVEYFYTVHKQARHMQRLDRRIKQEENDDVRGKLLDEFMDVSGWFEKQFEVVIKKFKPFLTLETCEK
jgi:hypothetical protein